MATPSDIEARVMLALDKLKIPYMFQYIIFGGTAVRGGVIVDFLVWNPFAQPVEVFGEYFHAADLDTEDRFRMARIEEYFGREVVILWGDELSTDEEALETVKEKLG